MEKAEYSVIGLMSGTSLDGLDIAFCHFSLENSTWKYRILNSETIPYDEGMKNWLRSLEKLSPEKLQLAHWEFGSYLGSQAAAFIRKHGISPDFVSSHGHTIFHQPEKGITFQAGAGEAIAAICKLPVVSDFRSLDVQLGGQGAPLVPIGDKLLFPEYDFCMNLGGFANISYEHKGKRIAYDICPVNIVMNAIAERSGKAYDENGAKAREGLMSHYLFTELNQVGFYKMTPDSPKSLGKEWVIKNVVPLLEQYDLSDADLLHTFCEHIAFQVGKALKGKPRGKLLITGGGAYNGYLMERLKEHVNHEIFLPEKTTIDSKEALLFAFLGVLRIRNEVNCLKSVTGASRDSCGGTITYPQ